MEDARSWRDLLVEVARMFFFVVGVGFVIVVALATVLFALATVLLPVGD
jgi:hypothetical protein